MDKHQRYELRRKIPRYAAHASLRGCYLLHYVQSARQEASRLLSNL